jgi:cytochrome c oxidase assembly protein subunit 15
MQWHGAGYFLSGIGGVVLLAAAVWVRNESAPAPLPFCGWLAFVLVQIQGLLGGLRVVLFKDELGIVHATLAQLFFALLAAIALLTGRWWQRQAGGNPDVDRERRLDRANGGPAHADTKPCPSNLARLLFVSTLLVLFQLIVGATMRHQHAGLAIPDFPLAYGRLWPAMDAASVAVYNQHRMEITAVNPITSFQIGLQLAHRFLALLIAGAVLWNARTASRVLGRQNILSRLTLVWLGMILTQALLGAATIWTNKAADIATAHVLVGALSLATGTILCLIAARHLEFGSRRYRIVEALHLSPLNAEPLAPQT